MAKQVVGKVFEKTFDALSGKFLPGLIPKGKTLASAADVFAALTPAQKNALKPGLKITGLGGGTRKRVGRGRARGRRKKKRTKRRTNKGGVIPLFVNIGKQQQAIKRLKAAADLRTMQVLNLLRKEIAGEKKIGSGRHGGRMRRNARGQFLPRR
jgi:hypothetical protein